MKTASEIRKEFIDFFCKKHGHAFVPSSPVVPHDDPTLLFANAGMNQFKPYFLGTEKPKHTRVANTQKCIRAGGKHNDLDDVGKDTYHHTFFEMLGNWSFGDYFKKDAITWAWELLTQVWNLDPSRLHVTVFEGDPENGIPRDDAATVIWRSVGVEGSHIHLGSKKDNFWEMGDTGPCGPCTEIHIDRTPDKSGAKLVNGGTDKVIEIWNNVFIQFNRNPDKSLTPLPALHVDTGMGFERICSVIQQKASNYDTDVFTPLFESIQQITSAAKYTGRMEDHKDIAYRVIADHIRTLTFALTDGAQIGNEGRDYVLKRILRRAERYGRQYLGATEPFLHKLVPTLVEQMQSAFPELKRNPEKVRGQIYAEEESFLRSLDRGIVQFSTVAMMAIGNELAKKRGGAFKNFSSFISTEATEQRLFSTGALHGYQINYVDQSGELINVVFPNGIDEQRNFIQNECQSTPIIPGYRAFDLHSTHGLFIDIVQQMAEEHGILVDIEGYYKELELDRERSRKGGKKHQVVAVKGELPPTDDSPKYDYGLCDATVLGWVSGSDVIRSGKLAAGETAALLLDRTNFYAEAGGQVGDTGVIDNPKRAGAEFQVEDTQRLGDAVLHFGTVLDGELAVGDKVRCSQGTMRRVDIMRNHTATHLMNLALRQVLGQHVEQKGSLLDESKTRFDFSHDKPISSAELREIERSVNVQIGRDLTVSAVTMPLAEAKKIPGVRAVFGEKYPDPVRVVLIGPASAELAKHDDSVEFCGGTHVPRTGTIGYFKIVSQEGVAKGVRRLTAVTGRVATQTLQALTSTLDDLAAKFQCKPEELSTRVESLQDELKKLRSQAAKGQAADLAGAVDKLLAEAEVVNGVKLVIGRLPGVPADQYRTQVDRVRQTAKSAFIVFLADDDGKVPVVVSLTNDLVAKGLKAGDIIKPLAELVGGKGGGKPDLAQAGGKDPTKIDAALVKAREMAKATLSS